ncbi:hypothetical protein IMSHALPRED_000285 [Imshaugia aleurites]|uniref:Transmembrane protein n=1 Tax=Imshaugia aleurites TaxID=172621 RepID=A0A8H3EVC8_9LECA|nr:hypothetical protein IMSHALPRED_000285 [Imshaugia aleurites]
MSTSTLSLMDEKPSLESYYRNLSILATAALAVHLLWIYESPGDSLGRWLASTMPTVLTGILLSVLFLYAAYENQETTFFSLTETSTRTRGAQKRFRKSSNPAREDRHVFNVLVIAFAGGLGVSVDLVSGWYVLCQAMWGDLAEKEPNVLLFLVALFTGVLGRLLFLVWAPIWILLLTQREFCSQLYTEESDDGDTGDAGSKATLRTLFATMETYEMDLRSQRKPSQFKKEVISDFLEVLRKW